METGRPPSERQYEEALANVAALQQANARLVESEALFRGTFENAGVGISQCNPAGFFIRVNQTWCDILEYSREELMVMTFRDVSHPDDMQRDGPAWEATLRGDRRIWRGEKRYVKKSGGVVWCHLTLSLLRDPVGAPLNSIAIIQDVTERRALEAALRQARDVAEAANHAKDDFLANVSHEIRTPMNAILGMTELVLDTSLNTSQRQSLTTVMSAASSLLSIIDDLLDFSKIEAGKLSLNLADLSLRPMLQDTLHGLAVRAHKKELKLSCRVDNGIPDALRGDEGRLRQILLNLVGNAIKFTHRGEVHVELELASEASASEIVVRFDVRDTGVGIPFAKQGAIFRAFEQEDMSTTRKYGGTGLGLTIAARLVALMGGDIQVSSEPGVGSVFSFHAHLERARVDDERPADEVLHRDELMRISVLGEPSIPAPTTALAVPTPPSRGAPLRILVAEDNELNAVLIDQLLAKRGHRVELVRDGQAALARLSTRGFDLLLLDLHMPELDGFEVIRELREAEQQTGHHLPVVALTARSQDQDRQRCMTAGMDGFVTKPIAAQELWATIDELIIRARLSRGDNLIDPPTVLASCDEDESILQSALHMLQAQLPLDLDTLRRALEVRACPLLATTAHHMSSTVAVFSPKLQRLTGQLELEAEANRLEQTIALVLEVETLVDTLLEQTRGLSIPLLQRMKSALECTHAPISES